MTLDRVNTTSRRLAAIERLASRRNEATMAVKVTQDELTVAMREARRQYTLQQIGDAAGLSRERVRQLLKED